MGSENGSPRLGDNLTLDGASLADIRGWIERVNAHLLVTAQMGLLGRFHEEHCGLKATAVREAERVAEFMGNYILDVYIAFSARGTCTPSSIPRGISRVVCETKIQVV